MDRKLHTLAHIWHTKILDVYNQTCHNQCNCLLYLEITGGRYRIRTSDFLRVRQAQANMPQPVPTGQYRTKRLQQRLCDESAIGPNRSPPAPTGTEFGAYLAHGLKQRYYLIVIPVA